MKNREKDEKPSDSEGSAVEMLSGLLAGKLPAEYDAKALREERLPAEEAAKLFAE